MVNVSQPLIAFAPERRVSNASPDTPTSFEQRMQDMRDFRDAKAMARTLRADLAAKGLKITIGQSLELIAKGIRRCRLEYSRRGDPPGGACSTQ